MPMKPYIVGLTGGIGSGKTTISDYLHQKYHIDVIDADVLAKKAVDKRFDIGQQTLLMLQNALGDWVLDNDGCYNKMAVRERVFDDLLLLKKLNAIIHPVVFELVSQQLTNVQSAYVILSVPLLFENRHAPNNLLSLCHSVLVVDVAYKTQIARASRRDNIHTQNIKAIINQQISRQQRLDLAHQYHYDIIHNDADLDSVYQQLDNIHQKYLKRSQGQIHKA